MAGGTRSVELVAAGSKDPGEAVTVGQVKRAGMVEVRVRDSWGMVLVLVLVSLKLGSFRLALQFENGVDSQVAIDSSDFLG